MKKLLLVVFVLLTTITVSAQRWLPVKTDTESAQYIEIPDVGMVFLNDKNDALSFHTFDGLFDFHYSVDYIKTIGTCHIYDANGKQVNKFSIMFGGMEEQPSIAIALKSSGLSKVVSWIRHNRGSVRFVIPRYNRSDFDITVPTLLSQRHQSNSRNRTKGTTKNRNTKRTIKR